MFSLCTLFITSTIVFFVSTSATNGTPKCDVSDRQYSCDVVSEDHDDKINVVNYEKFNDSSTHFLKAIKSIHYCEAQFHCEANFQPTQVSDAINTKSSIVCFSDLSCIANGIYELIALNDACFKESCMFFKDLIELNVTNALSKSSTYNCIKIGPENLKNHYCLKPACKNFMVIENLCVCNFKSRNCSCSSYCRNLLTITSHKTYGLFLSFADVYTTNGDKGSFLHWAILLVLCIGLIILLIIFCRLCKVVVDPGCGNEPQNPEIIRRILASNVESGSASVSTTAKSSISATDRCSPPPTYEQVLKDKCVEFKKSLA